MLRNPCINPVQKVKTPGCLSHSLPILILKKNEEIFPQVLIKTDHSVDGFFTTIKSQGKFKEEVKMVHTEMVGITELMTDDNFLGWMENQADDLLDSHSTFEVYHLYCREAEEALN